MTLPSIDESCGAHFRYRELIEVGQTWGRYRIDNRPSQLATYAAMRELCEKVLDPAYEQFGPLKITYAFVSPQLDKLVRENPRPNTTRSLDQHAGCELNGNGKPYCRRLGLAADLLSLGYSSIEVARWIYQNTQFDRLYFYSADRPIHVSVGPDKARQMTFMREVPSGLLVPKPISPDFFENQQ
jgi:hypothetical protein